MAKLSQRLRENPEREIKRLVNKIGVDTLVQLDRMSSAEWTEAFLRRTIKNIAGPSPSPKVKEWLDDFEFLLDNVDSSRRLETLSVVEAALGVAVLSPPDEAVINEFRNRRSAKAPRPNAESLLTGLIRKKLRHNPEATNLDIKNAIIDEAKSGADGVFWLEGDDLVWVDEREKPKPDGLREEHRKKIRDLGSAISKARKKICGRELPLTG